MNIYQRLVLVLGAIVLVIVMWTTPQFITVQGLHVKYDKFGKTTAFVPTRDTGQIIIRAISVIGATLLVCLALKGIKKE